MDKQEYSDKDSAVTKETVHQHNDEINIWSYVEIMVRRWWIILLFVAGMLVVAYLYSQKLPLLYIYKFSLAYYDNNESTKLTDLNPGLKPSFDNKFWLSIMKSNRLNDIISSSSNGYLTPADVARTVTIEQRREENNIFNVTITTEDKGQITPIMRGFMYAVNYYSSSNLASKNANLIDFLEDQSVQNESQIIKANQEINQFCKEHNIVNLDEITNSETQLTVLEENLLNASIELDALHTNSQTLVNSVNNPVTSDAAFANYQGPLKDELINLQFQLSTDLPKYGEKHPKIISLRRNIQNTLSMIKSGMLRTDTLNADPTSLRISSQLSQMRIKEIEYETRISSLNKAIELKKLDLLAHGKNDEKIVSILRNKAVLEQTSTFIQKGIIDAKSKQAAQANLFFVLNEPALPERASNGKKKFVLLTGLIIGLAFGIAFSIIYEIFTEKVYSTYNLEKHVSYPLMCAIPFIKQFSNNIYIHEEKLKENLLPFNILKVRAKVIAEQKNKNDITLISTERKEGKSTICLNLAILLARDGYSVLLVDADLWSPALSKKLSLNGIPGVSNYLYNSDIKIESIIHSTKIENLSIIPAGTELSNIGSLLKTPRIESLQTVIRPLYDFVITDTPALLLVPESYEFVRSSSIILLLIRLKYTKIPDLKELVAHLRMAQVHVDGVIVNFITNIFINKRYHPIYVARYGYYYKHKYDHDELANSVIKIRSEIGNENS